MQRKQPAKSAKRETKRTMHRRTYKIFLVAGVRPNFMKIAPLWKALRAYPYIDCRIIHTGQHYDEGLSDVFFAQLGLPKPYINLCIPSGPRSLYIRMVTRAFREVCKRERPDLVVVVGDVNSTLGAALGARQCNIPVAHVESGLRSFDRKMPEELNRIRTDRIAQYLFVTEESGIHNLLAEGIANDAIFYTGNVMIDTLVHQLQSIRKSPILRRLSLKRKRYGAVTLHRPSNVDTRQKLTHMLSFLSWLTAKTIIVFPVHPRTRKSIVRHNLLPAFRSMHNLIMTEPFGYHDFLCLVLHARFVVTDSGGIQEETTYLGVPCFTLRDNTERPSTVIYGTNVLLGTDIRLARKRMLRFLKGKKLKKKTPPKWDGKAAERIAAIIARIIRHG